MAHSSLDYIGVFAGVLNHLAGKPLGNSLQWGLQCLAVCPSSLLVPMPTLDIWGVPHHYERYGPGDRRRGPTLVFIHGWLLSRHYWRPLMDRLSGDYACVSYDLRGFGDSQGPEGDRGYNLVHYAEDLQLLLESLKIDQAWLVGHSLGGSVAIWGGYLCPERVAGVVCVNAGGGIYLKEEFEKFRTAGERLVEFRPPWLAYVPGLDGLFSRMMVQRPLERQWGQQRLQDFLRADKTAARRSLLETTTEAEVHRLPQLVADLAQPLYFLAGIQDRVMELEYVRYLASFHHLFQSEGKNVIEIADCGHFAMLEQLDYVAHQLDMIIQRH